MYYLMRKFSLIFLGYLGLVIGVMFPLMNHDRLTGPDPFSLSFPYYMARYVFWVVLACIWMHEQMENKSRGYAFLLNLPLKNSTIVASKFWLVLITVGLYVVFHCISLFFISPSPDYVNPGCDLFLFHGNLCLIISGLLYLGIFRYGYPAFGKYVVITWVLAMFLSTFSDPLIFRRMGIERTEIIDWIHGQNQILWTCASLLVFAGLAYLSTLQKKKYIE